ncbi:hypothetical protein COCSADRAFT_42121 [Bipolaris sorokiniana ND90Pr]|uniref:Thioesterase domain-containing protein n=1 Tax=Cochliobolus sativus (strain ND90Pr / ATCC 201652) TaxID=665912 RepID=M2QS96_COCSN|nr:uncharacterized protein COCSADRAFT_42121 [Bipolaris sorokiniana ND90Pr]EMD58079.1 hypothetical protein COCSADRAFT_42121 [Bipolaris sorokiniana ND90Pr]
MDNPVLIQEGPTTKTPLFLVHDGGGTVYPYFLLNELERNVWGISNPRFKSHQNWTGGLPEMAKEYVMFMKSVLHSGEVILGGMLIL